MDAEAILKELRAERDAVDEAIRAFERIAANRGLKRRGRPPKWMQQAKENDKPKDA